MFLGITILLDKCGNQKNDGCDSISYLSVGEIVADIHVFDVYIVALCRLTHATGQKLVKSCW